MHFEDLDRQVRELVGETICDRYEIVAPIAIGGMATVFVARQVGLDREVAVKVLCPVLAQAADYADRFEKEAWSLARLDHPNCLRVIDYGITRSGLRFLVTELIRGLELRSIMVLPMDADVAAARIRQVLQGLRHAHRSGVIHRDLKPENILVTRGPDGGEQLKIVDFGIAKLLSPPPGACSTAAGVVFGTPQYMSPEQASGKRIDHRCDLYAAGALLYAMLAGRPPFDGRDPLVVTRAQIHDPVPPLPYPVPPGLAALVASLLAKDPDDRPPSAAAAIEALDAAMAGDRAMAGDGLAAVRTWVTARRWLHVGAAAAATLTLGLAVAYAFAPQHPGGRATVEEADRALAGGEPHRAREVLALLLDADPDDPDLLWRDGRALAEMGRHERALDRYALALMHDDDLQDDPRFFAELDELMRRPELRDAALDLALQRLGDCAEPFLLDLVNDSRHALPFVDRHRVIDRLRSTDRWSEVDMELQAQLDLDQAQDAAEAAVQRASPHS